MRTRTGRLLMNKGSVWARVQVHYWSQWWDLSDCCHASLCMHVGVGDIV